MRTIFVSDVPTFRLEFPGIVQRQGFIGRFLCPLIKVLAYTDDGVRCKAKIANSVRKEMRQLRSVRPLARRAAGAER
jgi:hypothetical protein